MTRLPNVPSSSTREKSSWRGAIKLGSLPGGKPCMNILGISAYYGDSAAALVRDGDIIAAAQEERSHHDPVGLREPSKRGWHQLPSGSPVRVSVFAVLQLCLCRGGLFVLSGAPIRRAPYELLRYLSSELFKFPFEKPFPRQNPDLLRMSLYFNCGKLHLKRRWRSLDVSRCFGSVSAVANLSASQPQTLILPSARREGDLFNVMTMFQYEMIQQDACS